MGSGGERVSKKPGRHHDLRREEVLTTGAGGKGFCASGARQKMAARHSVGQKDRSLEIDRTAEHIPARAGAGGKHSPVLD